MSVLRILFVIVLSIFCCFSTAEAQSSFQRHGKAVFTKWRFNFSWPSPFSLKNLNRLPYRNIVNPFQSLGSRARPILTPPADLSFSNLPATNKAKWEGLYLGVANTVRHAHNEFPKAVSSLDKDIFFGYDKLLGNNILLGVECGFSMMNARGYAQITPYSDQHKLIDDAGWNTHLQLHAGYVWDSVQAYLATEVNKSSISASGASSWQAQRIPVFGAGIEYAIKPNLRLRLGYKRNKLAYKNVTVKHSPMPTTPRTAVTNYDVENFSVGIILHWH